MMGTIGQLVLAYIAVLGFGLIINIPHQALNVAGWIGTLTWGGYLIVQAFDGGVVLGSLIGSVGIGVLSSLAARYKKMPAIIFNIPSLVSFTLQVIMITGAIALGFLLAELLNRLIAFCIRQWRLHRLES